jgi:hypothetical protein
MEGGENKNLMSLGDLADTRQSNIDLRVNSSVDLNGPGKLSNNALKLKNLEDKMNSLEVTLCLI